MHARSLAVVVALLAFARHAGGQEPEPAPPAPAEPTPHAPAPTFVPPPAPTGVSASISAYLEDRARAEHRRNVAVGIAGVGIGLAYVGLGTALLIRDEGDWDPILGTALVPMGSIAVLGCLFASTENDHTALSGTATTGTLEQVETEWRTLAERRALRRKIIGGTVVALSALGMGLATYSTFHDDSARDALRTAPLFFGAGLGGLVGTLLLAGRSDTEESWDTYRAMKPTVSFRPSFLPGGGALGFSGSF